VKRLVVALKDWRLRLREAGTLTRCRRLPSIRVGLRAEAPESVFAHWRSVEAWYRDDPSLLRRRKRLPGRMPVARTSPRRDETVVSP
jgi:hypothetical protein